MRGLIHGTMHLSIGQEASAVGICMPLARDDQITSTHRGHGHCIAKGAEVKTHVRRILRQGRPAIAAAAAARCTLPTWQGGNLGANGIVGGGLPIAVGAALAIKKHEDATTSCVVVLRRRRQQRRRLPRSAEHGVDLEAAGGLRLREQRLRHVDRRPSARRRSRTSPTAPPPMPCRASIVDGNDFADVADAVASTPSRAPAPATARR